ncbi:MAG: tRNA (adenosine(37)-N6)-dimethylallyltransferase MiaA [Crocinitomicaceae bacterium]
MSNKIPHILTILGPTASGKTNVACSVAAQIQGEIISADSRQVYKYMDIGTGKDLQEYTVNGVEIPYHLIDIHDPGYKYNIAEFQLDFLKVLPDIKQNNKVPILCGGSGLYIEAALKGNSYLGIPMNEQKQQELEGYSLEELNALFDQIDPKIKENLNNETKRRMVRAIIIDNFLKENPEFKTVDKPEFYHTIIGIDIDRELRREKITNRLSYRLNNGMIEEVQWLLDHYLTYEDLEYYGLEYKWIGQFLKNEITKKELFFGLNTAIHQFAKRQMTWFRRMEKNGYNIHWIRSDLDLDDKTAEVIRLYKANDRT